MSHELEAERELLTFKIDERWFGAEVRDVRDVFRLDAVTPVPLARGDVAGLLNLRGRIVTAIDARRRLQLPDRPQGYAGATAIGVERDGEAYALVVDQVCEVLRAPVHEREEPPNTLDQSWREVTRGVYRLERGLLVELNIAGMLDPPGFTQAVAA